VSAATGRDSARVWLRIADNGPGVPPPLRARIFESFFTTKAEGMGTGMGLAVSRGLVREHGGDLLLEPDLPGGGAAFRLWLPLGGGAGADDATGAEPSAEPGPAARVLVVDDEAELAAVMRDMLESAGYEVAEADSGAVALELLREARFDAVVCDLLMPDMDGAAFWREASLRHPALANRLLFVTGDVLSLATRRLVEVTGCEVLEKPFAMSELLSCIGALLARVQARNV
jgi:two-component system NtrC family sensor kinase